MQDDKRDREREGESMCWEVHPILCTLSLTSTPFGTYDTLRLKTNDDNHKNLRIYRTIKVDDIVRAQRKSK